MNRSMRLQKIARRIYFIELINMILKKNNKKKRRE